MNKVLMMALKGLGGLAKIKSLINSYKPNINEEISGFVKKNEAEIQKEKPDCIIGHAWATLADGSIGIVSFPVSKKFVAKNICKVLVNGEKRRIIPAAEHITTLVNDLIEKGINQK